MILVEQLTKSFGPMSVLADVSFTVSDGEKVGLVGPNGTGKSTLLELIAGVGDPDDGLARHTDGSLSYLQQDVPFESDRVLLQEMWVAFADVTAVQKQLDEIADQISDGNGDIDELIDRQASLFSQFESLDGYRIEQRIGRVLDGLGFLVEDRQKACGDFSGGWKMRIGLAKVLVRNPDHLLLDEPTNHLDSSAKIWLSEYLSQFSGSLLLVTHDREFLDLVSTRIIELRDGKIRSYTGNYSEFLSQKAKDIVLLQKTADRENREISRQERFIERFRSKATKATLVASREKALAKKVRTKVPDKEKDVSFQLESSGRVEREVVTVEHLGHIWEEEPVLIDANLLVERGEKVLLVGPNGSGKSTFLRAIWGEFEPTEGQVSWAERAEPAYYDQHQDEALKGELSVIEEVKSVAQGQSETEIRKVLGQFLFTGDQVFKLISVLSGGEKSRVALAKFLIQPSNVLILDEPTNHLDATTRRKLVQALKKYDGTILCASHDQLLVTEIASRVIRVEDGECVELMNW